MAERICLLTGNETSCNISCYNCDCGGEVALNNFYVPIYDIQRVCDIVKGFECTSIEGEEIAEYLRNELEKMTVCIEKKAADVQPVVHSKWTYGENESGKDGIFCSNCAGFVPWDYEYYDSPEELISDNPICSHCGAKMRTE